ncbi:hypothetical protein [Aureibacter tunicatorum]|uniref:Uncharacterized protein n=1 Tax=Aureibacter tunicatorum TaxID=866807 RepID=A0AAE4BSJ6_9BACT|nr:hypothetical protein [Aureibacter tunicatorum]MDR6238915.1 hypothetical protein [Aureibacter tunicatorum]BDD05158.1 hypothetical protein AUTU_26410 [Aureibacter tunicatorum]
MNNKYYRLIPGRGSNLDTLERIASVGVTDSAAMALFLDEDVKLEVASDIVSFIYSDDAKSFAKEWTMQFFTQEQTHPERNDDFIAYDHRGPSGILISERLYNEITRTENGSPVYNLGPEESYQFYKVKVQFESDSNKYFTYYHLKYDEELFLQYLDMERCQLAYWRDSHYEGRQEFPAKLVQFIEGRNDYKKIGFLRRQMERDEKGERIIPGTGERADYVGYGRMSLTADFQFDICEVEFNGLCISEKLKNAIEALPEDENRKHNCRIYDLNEGFELEIQST